MEPATHTTNTITGTGRPRSRGAQRPRPAARRLGAPTDGPREPAAAREVFRRLMDAVDPALLETAESALRGAHGVIDVSGLRMRWIGHHLHAEVTIVVDGRLSVRDAHEVAVSAEHTLMHAIAQLAAALVHADPLPGDHDDPHALLAHHRQAGRD